MKRGRWALRLGAGTVLFMALAGPAPGNVGGCGTVPLADARTFCVDQGKAECDRERYAGRITAEAHNACLVEVQTRCEGRTWPDGCMPSQGQADACINLLLNADLNPVPTQELYEMYDDCNLCM